MTLLEVERGSDSSKRGLGRKVGVVLPTSPRRQSEVGALMSELGELQQELQRVKTRSLAKKIVDEFDVNSDKMLGPMELEDAMNAGVLIAAHDAERAHLSHRRKALTSFDRSSSKRRMDLLDSRQADAERSKMSSDWCEKLFGESGEVLPKLYFNSVLSTYTKTAGLGLVPENERAEKGCSEETDNCPSWGEDKTAQEWCQAQNWQVGSDAKGEAVEGDPILGLDQYVSGACDVSYTCNSRTGPPVEGQCLGASGKCGTCGTCESGGNTFSRLALNCEWSYCMNLRYTLCAAAGWVNGQKNGICTLRHGRAIPARRRFGVALRPRLCQLLSAYFHSPAELPLPRSATRSPRAFRHSRATSHILPYTQEQAAPAHACPPLRRRRYGRACTKGYGRRPGWEYALTSHHVDCGRDCP